MTSDIRSTDGRVIGGRARLTRENILASLNALLSARGYHGLTVIEVARHAKTSPAAFYQYFPDLDTAVLELAQDAARAGAADAFSLGRAGGHRPDATEAVESFLRLHRRHRAVLQAVASRAAEGDKRFQDLRRRFLSGITHELESIAAQGIPTAALTDLRPTIAVLVLAVEALAQHEGQLTKTNAKAARTATVRLVHQALAVDDDGVLLAG